MPRSQMIAIREPGKKLASDFMEKALKDFPTALGYACPMGDEIYVGAYTAKTQDLAGALSQIDETYADDRVFYTFMNSDEDVEDDSLQPSVIIEDGKGEEKKVLLVAMTDGDFPGFESEDTTQTNDYRMIQNHIMPRLGEMLEVVDSDLEKLIPLLAKPEFKNHVSKVLSPRGAVTLIHSNKEQPSIAFSSNINQAKFDWGWATRDLGLLDKKTEAPAKKTLSLKKKVVAEEKPPEEKEEEPEKKVVEEELPKVESKYDRLLKDERFYLDKNTLWVKPWSKGANYKEMRHKFIQHFGVEHVPKNSEQANPESGKIISAGRPFEDLKKDSNIRIWAEQQLAGTKKQEPKEAESVPANVRVKDPDAPRTKAEEITLLLSKEIKEKYMDNIVKPKLIIPCPREKLEETVKKYPPFSRQIGETVDDILMWSPQTFVRIGHLSTHALICLAHELRCRCLGLYDEKQQKDTETHHIEQPDKKPTLQLKKRVA